jgi:thiol-disulfide isomerase/thioredoxin
MRSLTRCLPSVLVLVALTQPLSAQLARTSANPTVGAPAPAWSNQSWLNSAKPVTLASLKGRVVLLNFWVFTCGNCTRTIPSLTQLDSTYRSQG